MRISVLGIGAIASIIAINSVFADTTVTSKQYVDTQVATKQNKIDATGANFTNGSVVETTSTPGVVTQRGIFNPDTDFDYENNEVASGHEGDLVTAESIFPTVGSLYQQIEQVTNNLPTKTVTTRTCYQFLNGDCILWELQDTSVYGSQCNTASDCGSHCYCINHMCDCDSL